MDTKQVRVWKKTHKKIDDLCALIADEKGLPSVSFADAVSIAIEEAIDRRSGEYQSVAELAAALPVAD